MMLDLAAEAQTSGAAADPSAQRRTLVGGASAGWEAAAEGEAGWGGGGEVAPREGEVLQPTRPVRAESHNAYRTCTP